MRMSSDVLDTFICGLCGGYFHDISQFVTHKNNLSCVSEASATEERHDLEREALDDESSVVEKLEEGKLSESKFDDGNELGRVEVLSDQVGVRYENSAEVQLSDDVNHAEQCAAEGVVLSLEEQDPSQPLAENSVVLEQLSVVQALSSDVDGNGEFSMDPVDNQIFQVCIDGTNICGVAHFDQSTGTYYIIQDETPMDSGDRDAQLLVAHERESCVNEFGFENGCAKTLSNLDGYQDPNVGHTQSNNASSYDSAQTTMIDSYCGGATKAAVRIRDFQKDTVVGIELVALHGGDAVSLHDCANGMVDAGPLELLIVVKSSRPATSSCVSSDKEETTREGFANSKADLAENSSSNSVPNEIPTVVRKRGRPRLGEERKRPLTSTSKRSTSTLKQRREAVIVPIIHSQHALKVSKAETLENGGADSTNASTASGYIQCSQCHKSFMRERHFKSHRCFAEGDYVDPNMIKQDVPNYDENNENEHVYAHAAKQEEERDEDLMKETQLGIGVYRDIVATTTDVRGDAISEKSQSLPVLDSVGLCKRYGANVGRKVLVINRRNAIVSSRQTVDGRSGKQSISSSTKHSQSKSLRLSDGSPVTTSSATQETDDDEIARCLRSIQAGLAHEVEALQRLLSVNDLSSSISSITTDSLSKRTDPLCSSVQNVHDQVTRGAVVDNLTAIELENRRLQKELNTIQDLNKQQRLREQLQQLQQLNEQQRQLQAEATTARATTSQDRAHWGNPADHSVSLASDYPDNDIADDSNDADYKDKGTKRNTFKLVGRPRVHKIVKEEKARDYEDDLTENGAAILPDMLRNIEDRNAFDRALDVDLAPLADHMFTTHIIAQNENMHATFKRRKQSATLSVFTCNTCEKVFMSLSRARLHCLTHTDVRPFRCHRCSFSSNTKGNLYTHMRRHIGSMYRCSRCSYKTANRTHLAEHENTHAADRLSCTICNGTYNTPKSLLNHVRVYHRDAKGIEYFKLLRGPTNRKTVAVLHRCPVCDRKFKIQSERDKHLCIHNEVSGMMLANGDITEKIAVVINNELAHDGNSIEGGANQSIYGTVSE